MKLSNRLHLVKVEKNGVRLPKQCVGAKVLFKGLGAVCKRFGIKRKVKGTVIIEPLYRHAINMLTKEILIKCNIFLVHFLYIITQD